MSEFGVMMMEQIERVAANHFCSVVVARPNELQFDLDAPDSWEAFQYFFSLKLSKRFNEKATYIQWSSKSGNRHVVVTLPVDLSIPERIALQAQGGSDSGREFAALACHWDGSPHPILLFKPLAVSNAQ